MEEGKMKTVKFTTKWIKAPEGGNAQINENHE
jgi:hypothetical protein